MLEKGETKFQKRWELRMCDKRINVLGNKKFNSYFC